MHAFRREKERLLECRQPRRYEGSGILLGGRESRQVVRRQAGN